MAANVVPSAVQNSTQRDRDFIMSDVAFMSKGELIKALANSRSEERKLKEKVDKYLDESLYFKGKCIELNAEIERLTEPETNISYLRKAI